MSKYLIRYVTILNHSAIIEADSEEQAIDIASDIISTESTDAFYLERSPTEFSHVQELDEDEALGWEIPSFGGEHE